MLTENIHKANIRLGDHNYLVTLENSDSYDTYQEYRVLIWGNLVNDLMNVSDVWVVPRSLDLSINDTWITKSDPDTDYSGTYMSDTYENAGEPLNSHTEDVVVCKTNTLKVWHPSTIKSLNMIVHCYSVLNNIKFHWLLSKNDRKTKIAPEQRICHDTYSEYDEYDVPNIQELFNSDNWITFNYPIWVDDNSISVTRYLDKQGQEIKLEKITRIVTDQEYNLLSRTSQLRCTQTSTNPILYKYEKYNVPEGAIQQISFLGLLRKWSIIDAGDQKMMKFASKKDNEQMQVNEMVVTLFPWSKVSNNIYLPNTDIQSSSWTFTKDNKIKLSASLGFVNGKVSIVGKFLYDEKNVTLQQYYEKLYNVDLSKYKKASDAAQKEENDDTLDTILEGHPEMCGYVATIASDPKFQHVMWTQSNYCNTIDDFSMPLIDLFTNWNEVPVMIYAQVVFIDRYIGITLKSNVCALTKDEVKYMITDLKEGRATSLRTLQEYDDVKIYNPKEYKKEIEIMSRLEPKIFFIDNIRCNIVRNQNSNPLSNSRKSTRIIYKPLFYRTEDAQNIKIRRSVTQNIGVNLSKYMTKVDLFYMRIDGSDFVEVARNGIYVIFKVDALSNGLESDKYDIIDNEGNYITTGTISYI